MRYADPNPNSRLLVRGIPASTSSSCSPAYVYLFSGMPRLDGNCNRATCASRWSFKFKEVDGEKQDSVAVPQGLTSKRA